MHNARMLWMGLSAVLTTVACGGGEDAPPAQVQQPTTVRPETPATPAAQTSATPPPATPPAATDQTPPPAAPGGCDANNLCLDVASIRPGSKPHAGRLVVAWTSAEQDGALQIAYDVAFTGEETQVQIPLANVAPPADANAFCQRECAVPSQCPCTTAFKMAYGFIVVVEDQNQSSKAEADEAVLGVGDANVVYSSEALNPPPANYSWNGRPMADVFPSGVQKGAVAYSGTDKLTPAVAGTKFKLSVCDSVNEDECSVFGEK